ncbi:MAG: hypothetical protein ACOY5U_09425 [Pseudomonadota bacterium]
MTPDPAPMTPAGCDLRDFPRMMIDIPRLFSSTFNGQASRQPLAWMIGHKLWYRSWHQVPAGSLPDDDDELCHLAELGFDLKSFRKVKAIAMRGWVRCADGRLYHPVVCEAALEAWQEKLRQRISSAAGNSKRWGVNFDWGPLIEDLRALIACMTALNPRSKTIQKAQKSLSQCDPSAIPQGPPDDPTGTTTGSHRDQKTTEKTSQGTGIGNLLTEADAPVSSAHVDAPAPKPAKQPRQKARRELPEHFPGDDEADYARGEFARNGLPFDFDREAQRFRNHHQSKGNLMADWRAAWRTWVANGIKFAAEAEARHASGPNPRRANGRAPWSAMDYAAERIREEEGFE